MLVLFFLYLGYIALASAERERGGDGRIAAIYGLVGAINLPIIHYSVLWWRTLHQGESIGLTGSTIDSSMLWPLPLTMIGFTCLFAAAVLMRMRAELAEAKVEARMRRMGSMNPWPFVIRRLCSRDRADRRAAAMVVGIDAPGGSRGRRAQAQMKPKNQRLVLVSAALVALLVAVLLAMWGLRSQASFFYTPADIVAGKAADGDAGAARRYGRKGSIKRERPTASRSASFSPTARPRRRCARCGSTLCEIQVSRIELLGFSPRDRTRSARRSAAGLQQRLDCQPDGR